MNELTPEQRHFIRGWLLIEVAGLTILALSIAASLPLVLILSLGLVEVVAFIRLRRIVGRWLDPGH